jgi:hypothetical protein
MRELVPPVLATFSTLEDMGRLSFVIIRKSREAKVEYLKK